MVKGFCSVCGKEVGTFFKPPGYQCRSCQQVFCSNCSRKIGLVFKKPACPSCGIELVGDARKDDLRFERMRSREAGYGIEEGRKRAIEDARERARLEAERRRSMQNFQNMIFGQPPSPRKRTKKRR